MIIQRLDGKYPEIKDIVCAIKEYEEKELPRLNRLNALYVTDEEKKNIYFLDGSVTRLSFPIAKYITVVGASYIISKQPTYSIAAGAEEQKSKGDNLSRIIDVFRRQNLENHDLSLKKQCGRTGYAYEYVYVDPATLLPKVKRLPETNTLVVFDDTVESDSVYGVYWSLYNGVYTVTVCTDDTISEYVTDDLYNVSKWRTENIKKHFIGRVPITLVKNNEEQQGDYEGVFGLIEAYNDITTDERYDIKRTVNAILVFLNAKLAGAKAEEKSRIRDAIRTLGMLELSTDGRLPVDVKTLTNPLDLTSTDTFVQRIWNAIFMLSFVPDPTRQEFYTAISGVALDMQMFMGLDQLAGNVEPTLKYALKRRLKMYAHIMSLRNKASEIDVGDVEIKFNHNRPTNNLEAAQLVGLLNGSGIVSKPTLAGQLSFVKDAAKEIEAAKEEITTPTAEDFISRLNGTLPRY